MISTETQPMEPAYLLRHVVISRGISRTLEYRLYGPDGTCRLTATAKASPYLPSLDIRAPDGSVGAKVTRGRLLNFDIVLTTPGGGTIARIGVPRIQSIFHDKPFAVTGPQDELLCQLVPRSALPKMKGEQSPVWDTITDNDLVIVRDADVLGYTGKPGIDSKTAPSATGVARNIAALPVEIGKFIVRELTEKTGDTEVDDGTLRLSSDGWSPADEVALLILLFRRYDYRAMRSIE